MPRMQPDVLEEFLKQPFVGVIASLRRDGMPYTVPVWWPWREHNRVIASRTASCPTEALQSSTTHPIQSAQELRRHVRLHPRHG